MFRSWDIDFDRAVARMVLANGKAIDTPVPPSQLNDGAIRRSRLDFERRELLLTLDDGHKLTAQIGDGRTGPPEGVPTVYLDQLHWITLAQQLHAPEKVREPERDAADTLIELARSQKVILPMAGAHFTESATTYGQRRRNFALTLLELSRGWQLRNPVRVRADEYRASMRGQDPVSANALTLDPGVLLAEGPVRPEMSDMRAPPELIDLMERVTAVTAVYGTLLDDQQIDMSIGFEAADRWAASFPPLAEFMRKKRMPVEHARQNALARFLADQRQDIAQVAATEHIDQQQFLSWLNDVLPSRLAVMPYCGRLAELLFIRLRNADEKWERNDLNDMNFLCAAAGYADIVVGEKKTSEYLRRAEPKVRPGAAVCRRLEEAVVALKELGVER